MFRFLLILRRDAGTKGQTSAQEMAAAAAERSASTEKLNLRFRHLHKLMNDVLASVNHAPLQIKDQKDNT